MSCNRNAVVISKELCQLPLYFNKEKDISASVETEKKNAPVFVKQYSSIFLEKKTFPGRSKGRVSATLAVQ